MAWQPTNEEERLMFRPLTDEDEEEFRAYGRFHKPIRPMDWRLYHPVVREEWLKRGLTPPEEQPTQG